jgi:hypothetical protein
MVRSRHVAPVRVNLHASNVLEPLTRPLLLLLLRMMLPPLASSSTATSPSPTTAPTLILTIVVMMVHLLLLLLIIVRLFWLLLMVMTWPIVVFSVTATAGLLPSFRATLVVAALVVSVRRLRGCAPPLVRTISRITLLLLLVRMAVMIGPTLVVCVHVPR